MMRKRITGAVLAFIITLAMLPGTSLAVFAGVGDAISLSYGDHNFTKASNPASGSREADGINTNDVTGFDANRLNSYAWAVSSRGSSIYIGTNRTLFGSSLNALAEVVQQQNPDITSEKLGKIIRIVSGGEVPVNLKDEDYVPQIIRFDVDKGSTEVIYQPGTAEGEDGRLYYTDKDGNIIPASDVASEAASFRSVIQYNGNLYFGSLGSNMLQLIRVDENDNAEVVFQTIGSYSSLRACCAYDDGSGETIYFGGQDATNLKWRKYRMDHLGGKVPLPIVIRYLDPDTAGTDSENWSGLVADFEDFGEYSYATVYANGGGNVWDLCSYDGKIYLILAYDGGWAMFRGEKGGSDPNAYGWTWTEIVGNNGKYPLAMNSEIADLNEQYRKDYGCSEFAPNLTGTGLLESTATPYVYNGKMYIGSFDNATALQAQTVTKFIKKLQALKSARETGEVGPSLSQIFAPFYEALSHPQHIWVMDEDENISPVESANALLDGTTNDYVWRFIEYDGKLYAGTFDSSTAYNYFLDYPPERFMSLLKELKSELPPYLQLLLDCKFTESLRAAFEQADAGSSLRGAGADGSDAAVQEYESAALNASSAAEAFVNGDTTVDELLDAMTELQDAQDDTSLRGGSCGISDISEKAREMSSWLLKFLDVDGLRYWCKARYLIRHTDNGFDLFVTEDGENWSKVLSDGLNDPYNYGARTFTICNGELYLGTANPYFGAQLWNVKFTGESPSGKITEPATHVVPVTVSDEKTVPVHGKALSKIRVKTTSKTYKASALKKGSKKFSIKASVNSKAGLSYKVVKYKNKASEKYLKFNTRTGKVTVKKGTPKGKYWVKVKIRAKSAAGYKASSITRIIRIQIIQRDDPLAHF